MAPVACLRVWYDPRVIGAHMSNLSPLSTEQPGLTFDRETPKWVFDFFPIGDSVRNLLKRYIESGMLGDGLGQMQGSELEALALSFRVGKWSDSPAATLIGHLIETSKHTEIDLQAVTRSILLHHDDPDAVSICMAADPPSQIDIVRLLPRTGSQKLVFEARDGGGGKKKKKKKKKKDTCGVEEAHTTPFRCGTGQGT